MIRFFKFLLILILIIMYGALLAQTTKGRTNNEKQDQQSIEKVGKKISEMPQKRIKRSTTKNSTSFPVQKETSTTPPVEEQHQKSDSSIKKSKTAVKKAVPAKTEKVK